MASELPAMVVRVADAGDIGAIASLRSLWSAGAGEDPEFERRMAAWLAVEGDRRTTWLATLGGSPVGMVSVFEYRRMSRPGHPDSRWGYVGPDEKAGDDRLLVRAMRRGWAERSAASGGPALSLWRQ